MKFESSMKYGFKIFQLFAGLLLLVHWLGCILYLLINIDQPDERYKWMPPKDFDAQKTDFWELTQNKKYWVCSYYAILMIVGNEGGPKTPMQTLYCAVVVILGSIVTAFIFGNMAALLSQTNKKQNTLND